MKNIWNIDLLFVLNLPKSIQGIVKKLIKILNDKEKKRIRYAKDEELFYIYYTLGLEIERAMLAFHPFDTMLYDSLTGKAVPISSAYNMIIDQLRWRLKFGGI